MGKVVSVSSPRAMHAPDRPAALAVFMRTFEGGGAQRDMVLLCNGLAAKGVAVTFLVLCNRGPLRSLLDDRVRVHEIGTPHLRYAITGLRNAIRHLAPKIVVASEASQNLFLLAATRLLPRHQRPKVILREVGSPSIAEARDPYFQNRIAYRILRRVYRYADRVVTLTDGAYRDLARHFAVPQQRIRVMRSNAVVPPAAAERLAQWDGEAGRERDLIVSVGRLSPEKDHRTLLRAASLLPAGTAWRLAIVGEGPERASLEALARELGIAGRTIFTGAVADPFPWLMRAGVAVCSSVYEGLGNAIIEALACGTPVVATDCPYGPREILKDGQFGSLTPVGDASVLAAAIGAALETTPDRRVLMRRGLDYTSERAAEAFLDIASELVVESAGRGPQLALATRSATK